MLCNATIQYYMKYYIITPATEAETGEEAIFSTGDKPRKIVFLHVYLVNYPESELLQAYPAFLVTRKLRSAMESLGISGVKFLPCKVSKDPQYDDYSFTSDLPEVFGMEPCGVENINDIVSYNEAEFKASERFVMLLKSFAHDGCRFEEI